MTATLAIDEVYEAVASVLDPELPAVTLGMLGMVHDVALGADGAVEVDLLPTFSGCPATEMIGRDVEAAVRALGGDVTVRVRFRYDPPWTPDRITSQGHDALREFGIAPPGGATGAPEPGGRVTLPLAITPQAPRPCPYCGSTDTVQDSAFGPTPCRDVRFCEACQQPFEAFKS